MARRDELAVQNSERPWMQSVGFKLVDSPTPASLAVAHEELWVIADRRRRHTGGLASRTKQVWLNAGTDTDGRPTWSSVHQALYTPEMAASIILVLDNLNLITYRMK